MSSARGTRLSVNVNKIALLRNSRGGNNPNVLQTAKDCLKWGAQGITVHPRPDGRHIRREDVFALAELLQPLGVEYNIEGYPSEDFLQLLEHVKPTQATLVPDAPNALTSDAGWDTIAHQTMLQNVVVRLHLAGIRVSLFVDTNAHLLEAAKKTGADCVELYTGPYAQHFAADAAAAVAPYVQAGRCATELGLGLNAGHDLNRDNLSYFLQQVPNVQEVSIGHALVCDALYLGLQETLRQYLHCLTQHSQSI
jgi:pyridoxine 5-phosphate synthase